jgi:ABC-type transport system substrate-binding protein
LLKNKKYYAEELFIDKVSFYFFENYSDYKKSLIFSDKKIIKNIFSVSYDLLSDISGDVSYLKSSTISLESGRNFALFINPKNSSYLISKPLRKAISLVINSDNIIEKTLQGHGQNISSFQDLTTSDKISEAKKILSADFTFTNESGKNILISNKSKEVVNIELSILDSSEFRNIAKLIQEDLEVLGIGIDVISYSESDLIENAVRGREFEMLLFGYQTDVSLADTYYLFHSSQISDPGINISNFSNSTADNLILDLRKNIDDADRFEKTKELYDLIISESAYIPLYSPNYIYVMDSRIQNFSMKTINSREDRFRNFAT